MAAYYNEIEPFAAAWLRELMKRELIAPGDVDERSIANVRPDDVRGYTQCHFFAGIGVWSYALFNAGWADTDPVWTGSCPCQPFSAAGNGKGSSDERHLWPEFFRLIRECRPGVCFGEQVASPLGRAWLDAVSADLEGVGYAVGPADLCAAGVGAPHIRQRLYWVADAECSGSQGLGAKRELPEGRGKVEAVGRPVSGFWADAEWVACVDGRPRPIEPGTFPLAHRPPARVGRLRGYGNAIVPEVAQAFIEAYLDVRGAA